jgi:hypothetical protein
LKKKFQFLSSSNNAIESEMIKVNNEGTRIQLNFDSNQEKVAMEVKMMFHIFYWAAFLGKE